MHKERFCNTPDPDGIFNGFGGGFPHGLRDTLATACPTGLQSVCNAILGELRGERSESGEARNSAAWRSRHQKPNDGDGHSGCREYCSDDPPEKASFEVGDCSVNLGNVNFGCKVGEVGLSAFAHRLYNGFGLWPFEASGFQVAGSGERIKRSVHDVIILQFVSRLKVE